ncbi:MAG: S8 family serine peptidase [Candidatus Latescibacterota bacterium]|nr:MAG: S8 family serine peptidase [Candidatus Latescibacterota bacterium]
MKKMMIFMVIVLLALSSTALTDNDEINPPRRQYNEIYVPFRSPAPSLYYVRNQMVIKLTANAPTLSVIQADETVLTGIDGLDDLNQKYGVTQFVREFPDVRSPVIEQPNNLPQVPQEDLTKYYILEFNKEFDLEEVMRAYLDHEYVEKVEPIGVHPVYEMIPNDPYFLSDQWNFMDTEDNDVDATDAWDLETGDETVLLGCLDTGVQYNSRDLGGLSPYTDGNVWINQFEYDGDPGVDDDGNGFVDDWIGWDFVDNIYGAWPGEDADEPDNEPTDFNGHGTHVAGIMGAITNNGVMVAGLAGGWNTGPTAPANGVKVMALRIGWSAPHPIYGYEVGYVRMDFAAQAIYYAVNKGVTAINCSWGSSNTGGLGAAVTNAIANGVIVVHAAGNEGVSTPDYLGSRTDVLNVCATDSDDVKAPWSNYGTWVDLAAPGVDVISTYSLHYNPNYVAWVSGTSQAAPHVAGAAGMLKSYDATLTWQEITDLIVDYTDNIDHLNPAYAGLMGSGRLNVFKSLDAAVTPSVTVIQPNGGEVLYIGQEYEIIWDASDNVGIDSTLVDYSVDSGVEWTRIATLEGNPGSFLWTVTGPPSDQCRVRVTCYDAVGKFGSDISDDDFCPPYVAGSDGANPGGGVKIVGPDQAPAAFALYQNRPNPFNPTTRIDYAVREGCHVRLDVFNVMGQRVTTLVNEYQTAGYKTVDWDANRVASGVYFYRLQAKNFVHTRKMILMK